MTATGQVRAWSAKIDKDDFSEFLRFLVRFVGLICVPAALAIGFVILLAWRTGATISPVEIARMQLRDPMLGWAGNGQYYLLYKRALAETRNSDIIILGHSRPCQLRSMMFKPYIFTNAYGRSVRFGKHSSSLRRSIAPRSLCST
jgi:hypothetical protein